MEKLVVFVTGSTRGIGRSIALRFAKEGYHVIINGVQNNENLLKLKEEIEAYGVECLALLGDVSNYETISNMFVQIKKKYNNIDVLINNAGISYVGLLTDMTIIEWQQIINVNLSSVFYCSKEVIPSMVQKKKGKIINISSIWGIVGASCETAYSATKGGINAFTKALAKELAPSNIQVNAIAFGAVDTDMNQCFTPLELKAFAEEIPLGRLSTPEEAAEFVYHITNLGTYFTGQVIPFDGGLL